MAKDFNSVKKAKKSYQGNWEPGKEVTERDRALAMDRALIMSKLFQAETFPKIIEAINISKEVAETKKQEMFFIACGDEITPEQKIWLWNYLKNYNPKYNWGSTGW
jgi:hypothetical protein